MEADVSVKRALGAGQVALVCGMGFLGSAVAAALRARGVRVLTADPVAVDADFRCKAADMPEMLPGMYGTPDVVFSCTATHGGTVEDYQACYPVTALALVRRFRCPVVACSSISVYETDDGGPVQEDSPLRREPGRAQALLQAEDIILRCGGVVARLSPLYDVGRCELLRRHLAGEARLAGPAGRMLNYLHRDDAVAALLLLAECGVPGTVYNVCGETLPHAQAYALMERRTGVPASASCAHPGRRGVRNVQVDTSRLRALGWAPARRLEDFFARPRPVSEV